MELWLGAVSERACAAAAAAFNHVKDEGGGDGGCGLARSVFRKVEPRRRVCPSIGEREGKAPRER